MGSKYEYTCARCEYHVVVSGGRDAGMIAVVETMTCADRREVVDVLVARVRNVELGFAQELTQRCPHCKGETLTPWPETHPCPTCGDTMELGGLIVLWD
jgi:translation initiation factor 2 gamma subunit (eIF-2gamma)